MIEEDVAAWEAMGRRISTPDGEVWMADLPAVEDVGNDPILVLHGFPTASFDWRHVLERLNAQHRVVLLDFFGFGLSDKPDRRYSIELQADATEAVAAAAGLTRVKLVSHDMGNTIGGELLARSLDGTLGFEVSRRVICNGSIYIEMAQLTVGQQLLLSLPDEKREPAPEEIDDGSMFKMGMSITFSEHHPPSADELQGAWLLVSRNDGQLTMPRSIRYIEDRRAREARYTGAIETHPSPVTAVWGRLDPVAVFPMAERFVAARPDAPLVPLDDVGHWPMMEDPDTFVEAVLAHL